MNLFQRPENTNISDIPLQLFNTETRELEDFTPLRQNKVTMYTCGPTVYDYAHIGNFRSFIFADTLKRTLQNAGHRVQHTINLTDFGHLTDDGDAGEDKILKGLKREGMAVSMAAMRNLSDIYIDAFKTDSATLNIIPPQTWSRASDFVTEQINLIKTLDQKGYTYQTSDGVYFDIQKFPTYGRLGNIDLTKLKTGARVEVNTEKHHPADFAVWKKGLLGWNSPWGKGFPGWHIECSAMAIATLGRQIDIHTGGIDHIHTHHNAEIAQSEAATGKRFVRYWLHNEFVNIEKTKISKSLGNHITLPHLQQKGYGGDDYRYWLLTAHYRSPVNFTFTALTGAKQALYRLKRHVFEEYPTTDDQADTELLRRAQTLMHHDLNTPQTIALMWEIVKHPTLTPGIKRATLTSIDTWLGIGLDKKPTSPQQTVRVLAKKDVPAEIQTLLDLRQAARDNKDWAAADSLREQINLQGYIVEDTAKGQTITTITP